MVAAALAALGGCEGTPDALSVDQAWIRLPAVPGRPAAAYFTIHGGPVPATLISVRTDVAIEVHMHDAGMRPLERLAIPANTDVPFAPGGRHVMLYNINPGVKPGRLVDLTLTFANGTRLTRKATVVAAGAEAR